MTIRVFKPNLQKVAVIVSGKKMTLRLCTNCLKKFRKEGKIKSYANAIAG